MSHDYGYHVWTICVKCVLPHSEHPQVITGEAEARNHLNQWVNISSYNWIRGFDREGPTDVFMKEPFNLQIGDKIWIRARIKNYAGWSSFVESPYQYRVEYKPTGRVSLF